MGMEDSMKPGLKLLSAVLVILVLCISGCASAPSNSSKAPAVLQSISLLASKSALTVGGTATLTAEGLDQYGNPFAITPTFKLTGTAVTLSGSTVTAVAVGSASVTASSGSVTSNSVSFTVALAPQIITFGSLSNRLVGDTFVLAASASSGLPVLFASLTPTVCSTTTALAAGGCQIQATQAGNAQYAAAAPVTQSFTIALVPPALKSITLSASKVSLNVGDTSTLTAAGVDQYGNPFSITPTFNLTGTAVTVSGNTVTAVAQGSASVTASSGSVTSNSVSFTVVLVSQTITFGTAPSGIQVGNSFTVTASSISGLSVTLASTTPAICSISQALAVGTCTIQATQTGNAQYAAATPVTQSFGVAIDPQTITFGALPNQVYGAAPITLGATASSGLPVSYSVTGPAALNGSVLKATGVGTVSVTASQAGNSTYAAATPVMQSFAVSPAALTVTADNKSMVYGQPIPSLTYTATGFVNGDTSASLSGTPAESTTAVSTSPVGTYPITIAQGSLTAANYTFVFVSGTFTVTGGASQTITFPALSSVPALSSFIPIATASSGLPVTFILTSGSGVCAEQLQPTIQWVTNTSGTCTIEADQAGNATYAAAPPVTQSFNVTLATQTITFGALPNVTYGASPITLTATASSGLAVSYMTTGPVSVSGSTLTITGAGTATVTANQVGNSVYAAATPVPQSLTIGKAGLTVTANSASMVYGQPIPSFTYTLTGFVNGDTQGTATTGAPTLSTTATATSAVGPYPITVVQGTLAAANYTFTLVNGTLTVGVTTQTITFPTLPSVQALSTLSPAATASSGLPMVFTSQTPSVCSITQALTSGTCTLEADQAGNADYSAAPSVTQSFTVTLVPQTITFPEPMPGQTFTVSATSSSNLPVTFSSPSTACTVNGTTVTEVSFGDCLIEANQAGNTIYAAAAPVSQDITIGQSLMAISVTPANASAYPGFPVLFTASALDQFNQVLATQPTFTWASDNPSVTVDAGGNATGAAVGTPTAADITASAGGVSSGNAVFTLNPAILTSVTLSPSSPTISAPSGSIVFSVMEQDQFGRPMAPYVVCTYSSDNTAAATIDQTGTVLSQNATPNTLTANIFATCNSLTTNTVVLTVNPQVRFAKTLVATPNPASVFQTITPTLPQSVAVTVIAYDEFSAVFATPMIDVDSGYDTTIVSATALNSGEGNQIIVQGVGIGTTTVNVHIDTDDSVSTSFVVNVTACTQPNVCYVPVLTTISITGGTASMEYQGTTTFSAQAFDQKGGGFASTFTWASTNPSVLTVDVSGNVTAVGVGIATVTASSGSMTGTSQTITVSPIAPAPISIVSIYPPMGAARITTAPQGMRPETITIIGTGFAPYNAVAPTVTFGSVILSATFVSSTQLTVSVPAINLAVTTDTNVPVFVTNPLNPDYTGAAVSNSANFLVFTEGMVSITFDDAYTSAYQKGIPIFNNAGIPVTAMIITGNSCVSLGTCSGSNSTRSDGYPWGWNNDNCPPSDPTFSLANLSQWDNTQSGCLVGVGEGADYMTWAQVQALSTVNVGNGVTNEIGAHTRSHNSISTLSAQDQVGEITGALSDLQAAGFINVHVMAYPYGDYGCLTINEVATAGCAPPSVDPTNGTGTTAPVIGGLVQSAGYTGARSSDVGLEGDNSGNPATNLPFYLASYSGDVTSGDAMTTAQLTAIVQSATAKGSWVIFLFHRVDECNAGTFPYPSTSCPSGQSPNPISIDDTALTGLASYLTANGIRTATISNGLAMEGLNGQTMVPLAFPTE
jgi:peptidoglycan/xylan/chitin deacetylase (PgdA/CDA1 family)